MQSDANLTRNITYNIPNRSILPHQTEIVTTIYSLLLLAGFVGNLIVIVSLVKYKSTRLQSVANTYILNLAFADMLFILTMPFLIVSSADKSLTLNTGWCKVANSCREINKVASVFTLVVLSFDRYLASYLTKTHLRSQKVGRYACVIIWIVAVIFSIPYTVFAKTVTYNKKRLCRIDWPRENARIYDLVHTILQVVLGFLLPLFFIILSYVLLLKRLRDLNKRKSISTVQKPNHKRTRRVIQNKKKLQ